MNVQEKTFEAFAYVIVSGLTAYDVKVTASGNATATSTESYLDALKIAENTAYKVAYLELKLTKDIIEETITIIENKNTENIVHAIILTKYP
jgi:hypothetical protein